MNSKLLQGLYRKYEVANLSGGKLTDALGDVYEEFVQIIFQDKKNWALYNKSAPPVTVEQEVLRDTLKEYGVTHINSISLPNVPKRNNGSSPKTDVHIQVNDTVDIKVSVKQSKARNVTVAECDVATIVKEVPTIGKNRKIIPLMEKHQKDASAKYFTREEREQLEASLAPVKSDLVRWALTGSPKKSSKDSRISNHTIMFMLEKDGKTLKKFSSHNVTTQIARITQRIAGFGTGLSWTYATGTKYDKIQFKCPVE